MVYSDEEIKEKLKGIGYRELINNKKIYPFSEVLKTFNLGEVKDYVKDVCNAKIKLDKISYPTKQMFRVYLRGNKVENFDMNVIGLMFTMAEIAKNCNDKQKQQLAFQISKTICNAAKIFYPEQRVILRREYVYVTKKLRGLVKDMCENNANLKYNLRKLYSTILGDYYFINDTYYLRLKKTNNPKGNYLDYITVSELQDLIDIQKEVIKSIQKYPSDNHLYLANRLASEKRLNFCTHHAGCFPFEYVPHTFKPARAYTEFNKLLKSYGLDAKSLKKDDDNLEKN